MALEIAQLEVSVKTNSLGKKEQETYKWLGKSPYLEITDDFWRGVLGVSLFESEISIGPYNLLVIEWQDWKRTFLCVRKDKFGALRIWLYKSTRMLDLIYRRFIITLAVWGLAKYQGQSVPTWQDINFLRRFLK